MKKKALPIKYLLLLFLLCNCFFCIAQKTVDTVYSDYSLKSLLPSGPSTLLQLDSGSRFIRIDPRKKSQKIEIGKMYSNNSHVTRKARWKKTSYGAVLGFKVLVTPGFECVMIFCDKDYYRDSLLVVNDTLFFKEMHDDGVELSIVYTVGKDSLAVREGYRNTRHDFLDKIYYNPAMKNHARWFEQGMLNTDNVFLLVKKGGGYEIAESNIEWAKLNEYNKNIILNKFSNTPSPFWVALVPMAL